MNLSRRTVLLAAAASASVLAPPAQAEGFDHAHTAWSALLKKQVRLVDGGRASQVRYAGMAADRAALKAYLASLSAVSAQDFAGWPKPRQMAFLINAYNVFTVELVLTRYPQLASIKELGGFLQSPWQQKFVPLLGQTVSLDGIEHEMLRARGRYDDPRIHFAVNCASIGCPSLREEAFVAERLDAQLDEQARRFMSDRSRNRWSVATQRLELSKIFDWYGEDFRLGQRGISSVQVFSASFANELADAPADRERIRGARVEVSHLAYDWALNDTTR